MSINLYLEGMHYVYRRLSSDAEKKKKCYLHVLDRKYFFSFIPLQLEEEEVCKTISDLLRSPAACVRMNRVFIE